MYRHAIIMAAYLLSSASVAWAVDCDFTKRIGGCTGRVEILSTSGSKPSFAAEIIVHSSAKTCSKVDYYLDNTPQRTALKARSAEPESVFSTRPISKKNFKIESCSVYLDRDDSRQNKGQQDAMSPKFFEGTWSGSIGWLMVSAPMTLHLVVNGNSVTGGSSAPNGQSYEIDGGRVSGNVVTYTYQQPDGDGKASVRITRKSANSISYAASASGITLSGTMQRQ